MKNEKQILKKLIEKAVKNGWKHLGFQIALDKNTKLGWKEVDWHRFSINNEYYSIIFDPSFCKAIFGKDWGFCEGCKPIETFKELFSCKKPWQYHIQQLAISKDRIKYLSRFL